MKIYYGYSFKFDSDVWCIEFIYVKELNPSLRRSQGEREKHIKYSDSINLPTTVVKYIFYKLKLYVS